MNENIKDIYIGNKRVKQIFRGGDLIYDQYHWKLLDPTKLIETGSSNQILGYTYNEKVKGIKANIFWSISGIRNYGYATVCIMKLKKGIDHITPQDIYDSAYYPNVPSSGSTYYEETKYIEKIFNQEYYLGFGESNSTLKQILERSFTSNSIHLKERYNAGTNVDTIMNLQNIYVLTKS